LKANITDITLVVDGSGSKQQRREDAEGGVNAFIQQQAEEQAQLSSRWFNSTRSMKSSTGVFPSTTCRNTGWNHEG
jgi:hypothetical protein